MAIALVETRVVTAHVGAPPGNASGSVRDNVARRASARCGQVALRTDRPAGDAGPGRDGAAGGADRRRAYDDTSPDGTAAAAFFVDARFGFAAGTSASAAGSASVAGSALAAFGAAFFAAVVVALAAGFFAGAFSAASSSDAGSALAVADAAFFDAASLGLAAAFFAGFAGFSAGASRSDVSAAPDVSAATGVSRRLGGPWGHGRRGCRVGRLGIGGGLGLGDRHVAPDVDPPAGQPRREAGILALAADRQREHPLRNRHARDAVLLVDVDAR